MTPALKEVLDNIMDVFTGADGGADYCKVRWALEKFEQGALDGSKSSMDILDIVIKFSKLLTILKERVD